MKDSRMFIVYWAVHTLIFYFTPFVFVGAIVTGNARLAPFLASIMSGFLLAVFDATIQPILKSLKINFKQEWQQMLFLLFVNVLGTWVIARYADLTGVGISSGWTAVILGILVTLVQWLIWRLVEKHK